MWVPVGPGWSLSCRLGWATGLPVAKCGAWSRPSWQGPRLCVCACVLVSVVQCDSGVGMLVLGGSSFLFELGWQLLAGTRAVRVTRCLPLCN